MPKLSTRTGRITTAGAAGSAAGNKVVTFPQPVVLHAVRVDMTGQPATADVTLTNLGRVLTLQLNSGADSMVQPVVPNTDPAGAASPAGDNRWEKPILHGDVTIAVAQGDAASPGLDFVLYTE
jgi:hypothetical protein